MNILALERELPGYVRLAYVIARKAAPLTSHSPVHECMLNAFHLGEAQGVGKGHKVRGVHLRPALTSTALRRLASSSWNCTCFP